MAKKTCWRFEPAPNLHFHTTEEQHQRARHIHVVFLLFFVVIALRLCMLHLLPNQKLLEEKELHTGIQPMEEPRGQIFDRNGLVLATNRTVPSLHVDPRKVSDPLTLTTYLSSKLQLSEDEVLKRLEKYDTSGRVRKLNPLKRWVTDMDMSELQRIVDDSGGAVYIGRESLRVYPHADTAAHLLGFVNRDGKAAEGLEAAYDKHLKGRDGRFRARKNAQRVLLPSGLLEYQESEGGEMLQLTIDINMQHALEDALDRRMQEVGAKGALGLIMNPKTGAILAMATRPAFDPNQYNQFPPELRKNRAIIDVFEPGSVFKIVTAAAALEHGLVTLDTPIDCEGGAFNPYGHRIRDFYKLGVVPFYRAIEKSSNVAVIKLAALLGAERLDQWIRLFGFGQTTSRDFQFESKGLYRPVKQWSRLSMGSLPMGQEIAVTMPQLARAFAVIANGGYMVEPYFVERAVARDGRVTYQHVPEPGQRILSPETAEKMQYVLHRVVLYGTGTAANIPEYRCGGKTGTAQMARTDALGYDPDRYTTVFVGFAPIRDPQLVAVIVVQEPNIKQRYGGYVCGPVFAEVVRDALIRMGVPEDPVVDLDSDMPVMVAVKKKGTQGQANDDDNITWKALVRSEEQEEDVDTVVPPPDPERLDEDLGSLMVSLDGLNLAARRMATGQHDTALPDLRGMTKNQARERLQRLGIIMDAQGAGWVVHQDPPPGTALGSFEVCALRFATEKQDGNSHDAR